MSQEMVQEQNAPQKGKVSAPFWEQGMPILQTVGNGLCTVATYTGYGIGHVAMFPVKIATCMVHGFCEGMKS